MLDFKNIAVIGASGGIGKAFVDVLSSVFPFAHVYAFSRTGPYPIEYREEASLAHAAQIAIQTGPLDLVIVANGILHDSEIMPEKSIKEISRKNFERVFEANTIVPALIAKYFLPHLLRETPSVFAALSARVGSISDNQWGGWYAYRASKAALNMVIKNAAIEIGRRNEKAIIVGLHPGTVDTNLSRPFQKHTPPQRLFTPRESVENLLHVLRRLTPLQSGRCFAWNGEEILP